MTEPFFPLDTLIGVEPPTVPKTADEHFAAQADRPGWLKTLGAAFRTENTVGSLIASESMPNPHRKEDGFDWNKAYAGLSPEVRLAHGSKFTDVHNQMAFDAEAGKIERERQDQLTLDSAGWRGTVAQIGAGLIDLPTLLPIGGEYLAAARGIKGVGMAAARMAAESGGAVAVQEAGLHATQDTRTLEESAIKVGMGAILGGVLGSGIGYLSAAERAGAERALARAQRIMGGEDAVRVATPIDETIVKDVASQLVAAGRPTDEAEASARLYASSLSARADRFGGNLGTPSEIHAREGMIVRGEGAAADLAQGPGVQSYNQFAGPSARTAPLGHDEAVTMLADGKAGDEIFSKTGWSVGADGHLRFEISDDTARLYPDKFESQSLANVLDHGRLFDAYPSLRGVRVDISDKLYERTSGGVAGISRDGKVITVDRGFWEGNNAKANKHGITPLNALLHEVQHAIQMGEGFDYGLGGITGGKNYLKSAGETEARNTQARHLMTAEERRSINPNITADKPISEQISVAAPPKFDVDAARARVAKREHAAQEELTAKEKEAKIKAFVKDNSGDFENVWGGDEPGWFLKNAYTAYLEGKIGHWQPEVRSFIKERVSGTSYEQANRGRIAFAEGMRPVITLAKTADASTFVHETGHNFLETLMKDAGHNLAPAELKADAEMVRKWLGVKDGEALGVPHHEKFAQGFEQYVREGKAPSTALARVFEQFRSWLLDVYKTMTDLGSPISDDVRGVFDRLVTSERPAMGDAALAGKPVSGGAAAVEQIAREDLGPSGRIAAAVTNASQINPNNRAMMSPFASTREVAQQLADNAIVNKLADKGESLGPSVEIMSRSTFNARLGAATRDADKIYSEYRKSVPHPMTSGEFDNAVGYAMRRGDQFNEEAQRIAGRYGMGDEEFVGKAAKAWRDKVANPFKEDAITSGLFPKDVDVTTADSWLHRFWDKQKLMQHETEAKGVFRAHFEGQLRKAGVEDWKAISDDATNAVYDKLTGKTFDETVSNLPEWIVPVTRGPLKDRTFNIPDRLVEKFLHNDAREVLHKASKTMAADTELTRRFGSADMADQLSKIVNEARDMRAKVAAAKTIQEIDDIIGKDASRLKTFVREKMGKDPLQARKDEALAYLNSEEAGNLRDIKAMRDLIRGNYGKGSDGVWSRISNAAMAYNYIRLMGGNVIANMGDVFRPAMVHGIGAYMRDGLAPLVRNMAAVKMSVAEAQEAGLVLERVMHSRLMTLAEIGDRYAENTGIERLLQNGTKIASRWNGILHFTDANQAVASVMSQNRIIKGILEGGDERYLAYLGISKDTADRLRPLLKAHAEKIDGVWVAHTSKWDDTSGALRRYYRGALMKDVDSVIVQRSVGDIPLFANTPAGKMMLQFRSFNLAAHQRVLIRGLQESPTNFVSGLVAMTSLGMMASYLRAMRGGEDRFKKFQEAAQNPGYLIGEGLDLSGIFTIPFELANTMEKITKVNPIKDPIKAAFGNPNVGESQRFASRGVVSSLLGPSAGLIDLASTVSQTATSGAPLSDKQQRSFDMQRAQLVPFYSYPGMREAINMMIDAR